MLFSSSSLPPSNVALPIYELVRLNDPSVIHQLISMLTNNLLNTRLRRNIAYTLAQSDDYTIVNALDFLYTNKQIEVSIRAAISNTLVRISNDETRTNLLESISSKDVEEVIKIEIVQAFGRYGEHLAIPYLRQIYNSTPISSDFHEEIMITLGALGDRSVFTELRQLLLRKTPPDTEKEDLFYPHGALESKASKILYILLKYTPPPQLVMMLIDTTFVWPIRTRIADTIGRRGDTSIIPTLLQILANRTVIKAVRQRVAMAIGKLAGDEMTVQKLVDLLPDSDIADEIHQALWAVSRRAGVTVIREGAGGVQLRVVKR